MLSVGWFRLARLTTGSRQGEECLDLSLPGAGFLLLAESGIWKRGALGFDLLQGESRSALALFLRSILWLCGCVLTVAVLSTLHRLSGHIPAKEIRKIGIFPEERACLDTAGLPGIA